ncbi:MAG: Crp/Fnr family transcriptional regulator [Saprospiraceae bacterium]|nr:Crp/Fnr family transcriptional regulator [Saprospiraceae bacterium]
MTEELLLANFRKHIAITDAEFDMVLKKLIPKKIKRKQFFLHEDQVAKDVAFVISGCLRSYSIDENGFEHILQFAPSEWWMTDMYSFVSQQPGNLNIDALEDTEVLLLSRKNQLELFDHCPPLERYFRILTEKSLVSTRQRLINNLSLTALQRYQNFCTIYPTLIHTLAQKQIAAFIGVTPQFLSKLKNEK